MFNINRLSVMALLAIFVGLLWVPPSAGTELQSTLVTPHMEVPLVDGQNTVYCSTFQIAWNDMKSDIIGEDIRLGTQPDLVNYLNVGLATRSDISDGDYFAGAGFGSDELVDGINRTVKVRFGDGAPVVDDRFRAADMILAYAFLQKSLQFVHPFDEYGEPLVFHGHAGDARVQCFGARGFAESLSPGVREQVEIIDDNGRTDFIVRIRPANPDDELVLANVSPRRTLLETVEAVESRIGTGRSRRLNEHDVLLVPKLDASIDHRFSSLIGLYVENEGFESYFVAEASQDVRFRMDERGVEAESEGIFALKKMYRYLCFDDPFLVYIKKKGARYPYLVMWVETPELMLPFE